MLLMLLLCVCVSLGVPVYNGNDYGTQQRVWGLFDI